MSAPRRVDQVLLERGLVDPAAVARAREFQQERGGTLRGAFQSLGSVDEEALASALAEFYRALPGVPAPRQTPARAR